MKQLLDVNVLLACLDQDHVHHGLVMKWFNTPDIEWALCGFTETGFLRITTALSPGQATLTKARSVLTELKEHRGYFYLPVASDWETVCSRFAAKIHGPKQITDAYLLGLAVENSCVLVTLDKGIRHLAGARYAEHVLVLNEAGPQL